MAVKGEVDPELPKELQEKIEEISKKILMAMQYAGEKFIKAAREQPGDHAQGYYEDKTGNLRNSIGYFIFHDGRMIQDSMAIGEENLLRDIESIINKEGFVLVGFAGMNYASHVESRGYNVIQKQADACIIDLTNYFKDIQESINKAA